MNYTETTGAITEYATHSRDYDYEVICGAVSDAYPEEYEIPRENTGTLKNQGSFGACVAEVIAQIAEAFWSVELGEDGEHSEGFTYGAYRTEYETGIGMTTSKALDFWKSIGTLPKKYFDILLEMPEIKSVVKKYPELYEIAKKYPLSCYVAIKTADKKTRDLQIKDALTKYQRGLVAVSHYGFSGGSHCIQLTGWNDKNNKYKYKNSWGEGFGDNGFAEIDKNQINAVYVPIFEDVVLPFNDVPENAWFYNDIKHMYFAGFANGKSENLFEPNSNITRAEAFALGNRILKEMDKRFDVFNKVLDEKYGA